MLLVLINIYTKLIIIIGTVPRLVNQFNSSFFYCTEVIIIVASLIAYSSAMFSNANNSLCVCGGGTPCITWFIITHGSRVNRYFELGFTFTSLNLIFIFCSERSFSLHMRAMFIEKPYNTKIISGSKEFIIHFLGSWYLYY